MNLEQLLAPVSLATFDESYRDRQPLYIPAGESGAARIPLDWKGFGEASSVMANWPKSTIRLARNGQQLDCSHVRTEADERGVADTSRTGAIDMAKVHDLMSQGYTFVGSRYEYASPMLADLCADLNARLNVRTTAMLFASFRNIGSFNTHSDTHDVVAIQCEGRKRWQVFANRAINPVKDDRRARNIRRTAFDPGEVILDEVLGPGDVIYVPKGFYHNPVTESETSLHVSLSLRQFKALELVEILRDMMVEDPAFRAQLPDVRDGTFSAIEPVLADLGERLAEMLGSDRMKQEIAFRQNVKSQPWHRLDMAEVASSPRFMVLVNLASGKPARREALADYLSGGDVTLAERRVVEWMAQRNAFSRAALAAEFSFLGANDLDAMLGRAEAAGLIAAARRA